MEAERLMCYKKRTGDLSTGGNQNLAQANALLHYEQNHCGIRMRTGPPKLQFGSVGIGAAAVGAHAVGALAVGALAFGAFAVGAIIVGALAINRLSARHITVEKSRLRSLEIDELTVGRLQVGRLIIADPPPLPDDTADLPNTLR